MTGGFTWGFPFWRNASLYCIQLIKRDEYAGFSWHSNSVKLWIMTSLKIAHKADNNGVRNIRHRYYTADMKHLRASLLKLVLRCNGYAVRCFNFGTQPLATYIYAVPKENGEHFDFHLDICRWFNVNALAVKCCQSVWLIIRLVNLLKPRSGHSASPETSHILYQLKVYYCCHNSLPLNDIPSQRIQSKS